MNWVAVPGFEERYEVSDQGKVRTKERVVTRGFSSFTRKATPLKTAKGGRANNYLRVQLMAPACRKFAYLHHLVAEAFLGPRPNGAVVCHKNDVGTDNRLANLYYGSEEDNLCDRHLNSLDLQVMEEAPF